MISISKPFITREEEQAVIEVLRSGFIVQGPKVAQLEKEMAALCGTTYAIAVNNGTAALHTALYAIGIQSGDEVITVPFTFVGCVNAILMAGAKPVFVDIREDSYTIDPGKIEEAITPKTKAILAINLYGQAADYAAIKKIAKKYHLLIIEDAAQSINAEYRQKKSGNLADIGCFSFYATKNIASGEGGIITTNNKRFFERCKLFRDHGQKAGKRYQYVDFGYNYRMTDLHAAIALVQLRRVKDITAKRGIFAKQYTDSLQSIRGIITPEIDADKLHVFHQYTIRITKDFKLLRDGVKESLYKKGIASGVYYPIPLHKSKYLKKNLLINKHFPISEKAAREVLSLPVHPLLTQPEISYIINTIQSI